MVYMNKLCMKCIYNVYFYIKIFRIYLICAAYVQKQWYKIIESHF